ncbi:MAG: YceI family protein [Pseudomonadota bacterium]
MRIRLLAATAVLSLGVGAAAAETYTFDPGHTQVRASWDHAGMSEQSVHFRTVNGSVEFDLDNIDATEITVEIPLESIDTGIEAFDGHMAGADLFNTAEFPTATFVSTGVERTGDTSAKVTGDLTIRGVTNPITLDVSINAHGEHPLGQFIPYFEGNWIGLTATGTVNRSDWGLDLFLGPVSDEIDIFISTEMKGSGEAS